MVDEKRVLVSVVQSNGHGRDDIGLLLSNRVDEWSVQRISDALDNECSKAS